MTGLSDDHIETYRRKNDYGDRKEITLASVLAAAALAWTLVTAWTGFRDGVFNRLHTIDVRLGAFEQYRITHQADDANWNSRILKNESKLDVCMGGLLTPDDRREIDRRIRVLEQGAK